MRLAPISDYGPNDGTPTPSSPSTAYDKVDEDPTNNDTDYVTIAVLNGEEAFAIDVSGLNSDDLIPSLDIEWRAKAGDNTYQARAGLLIAGTRYYAAGRMLDTFYQTFTETFAVDPSDGNAWTKAKLGALALIVQHTMIGTQLPRPRFTTVAGIVTPILAAPRPTGTGAALADSATAAPVAGSATAAAVEPSAGVAGIAPSATNAAIAGAASVAALAPAGSAAAVASSSAITSGGNPSAIIQSGDPSAAVAVLAPTAIPSAVESSGSAS